MSNLLKELGIELRPATYHHLRNAQLEALLARYYGVPVHSGIFCEYEGWADDADYQFADVTQDNWAREEESADGDESPSETLRTWISDPFSHAGAFYALLWLMHDGVLPEGNYLIENY